MNRSTRQEQPVFPHYQTKRHQYKALAAATARFAATGALLLSAIITPAHAAESDADVTNTAASAASPLHLTGNIGIASQYIFRGTTQTNGKPALQGGFDLTHDNGLYAGIWLSNVSWITDTNPAASASLEADLYGGWKPALMDWLKADLGVLHYAYPGSYPSGMTSPDTTEVYAGLDAGWITAKISRSTGNTFGNAGAGGTTYADLSLTRELFAGINGVAHIGRQRYRGPNAAALSYTDWKLGLTRDFSGYVVGVAWTDTNAADAGYTIKGKNIGRNQLVLSLNKTF